MAENKAGTSNRGPMGGRSDGRRKKMMHGGEKAKNFREGSFLKKLFYVILKNYKFAILANDFCGNIYSIFSSWTKSYGKATSAWPKV